MKTAIYKYDFKAAPQARSLLAENNRPLTDPREAQALLGRLLDGKSLSLTSTNRSGETVVHENDIRRTEAGLTLIDICNEKQVSLTEHYRPKTVKDYPFLRVVIDNREGVAQIAIEKKTTAFPSTDRVSALLEENLNRTLAPYGLVIEIRPKMQSRDFWRTVRYQTQERGDVVKSVSFNFDNPREHTPIDASEEMKRRMEYFNVLGAAMSAAKKALVFSPSKGDGLSLTEEQKDLAELVEMCCRNGYSIGVQFREMGLFRVGSLGVAVFNVDDRIVNDFECGARNVFGAGGVPAYELAERMESIRNLTHQYEDEA